MKTEKKLIYSIILCFFLVPILAGCLSEPPATKPSVKTYSLPTARVEYENISIPYITTGSVVSDNRVQISSRITGFIKKITVTEGEKVKTGQLLVIIDDSDVEGAIRRAKAVEAKAKAAHKDAKTDAKRFEALFSCGSASDNSLRKARLKLDTAKSNLCEAKATLQTAVAQREYIRIKSPIDGVVIARHKRKGDLATPGIPVLTVESTKSLLFETYVTESQIRYIDSQMKVKVIIDAQKSSFEGKVARIVPSGDPVTRRYQVKISLPNIRDILPGMFGRAYFVTGRKRAMVIPRKALNTRGDLKGIFVLDKNNRAYFRWLRTGRIFSDKVVVKAGIDKGERIVTVNQPAMRDGDIIKVIPDE